MLEFWIPELSSGEIVAVDRLEASPVRHAVARWRDLRQRHRYPENPRELLADVGDNAFLVEILDQDYRYARVGRAVVEGFDEDFSGLLLSVLTARRPRFGIGLRMLYDMARSSLEPLGYRGWTGKDMPGARFAYHENAILPFGTAAVEQLVVVSALVPRQALHPRRS